MVKALQIAAIVLVALCLVPEGAHLFEMRGKMGLDREAYFATQRIYRGWALFGIAEVLAVLATGTLAFVQRGSAVAFRGAGLSCALLVVALVLFLAYVFPANAVTKDWTFEPPNWEALRRQWETVHAIDAVLTFAAFLLLTGSVIAAQPGTDAA
jgi:hypothetical protein